jgi:hypothetical protein
MKEEFKKYLEDLGINSATALTRAEEVLAALQALCPESITDICVSEVVRQDGVRIHQSLVAFSPSFCLEAKGFLASANDDLDILLIRTCSYLKVQKAAFDFKTTTELSRLSCIVSLNQSFMGGFSVGISCSSTNCLHVWGIIKKYLLARLSGNREGRDTAMDQK